MTYEERVKHALKEIFDARDLMEAELAALDEQLASVILKARAHGITVEHP